MQTDHPLTGHHIKIIPSLVAFGIIRSEQGLTKQRLVFVANQMNEPGQHHGSQLSIGLAIHVAPDEGLSYYTHNALMDRGIPIDCTAADKASVTEDDLRRATRRIALLKSEHRPYISSLFPDWEDKVEYWHAEDLDVAPAEEVLPVIEAKVIALVRQLARKQR